LLGLGRNLVLDDTSFSILCVCTGNICRSPVAERLLEARLGSSVQVSSAGTFGVVGAPIAEPMAHRLRSANVTADSFAARRLLASMARSADLVLTLTKVHRSEVVELSPAVVRRSFTLLEFARLLEDLGPDGFPTGTPALRLQAAVPLLAARRSPSPSDDVDDPIGRPDVVYERVFGEITQAVDRIAAIIVPP
jgi:protein-tyrosine phosphatase